MSLVLNSFIKNRLTEKSSDLRLVLFKGQDSRPYMDDRPLFALKTAPSRVGSGPSFSTWFLWPAQVNVSNGTAIGSVPFAGRLVESDRLTDPTEQPTPFVAIGRIWLVLQCSITSIVVKFEEVNLKFGKVRKSSRSTCNHDCYLFTRLSYFHVVYFLFFSRLCFITIE